MIGGKQEIIIFAPSDLVVKIININEQMMEMMARRDDVALILMNKYCQHIFWISYCLKSSVQF